MATEARHRVEGPNDRERVAIALVSREATSAGTRCRYDVRVSPRWVYVRGHFPGNPIVPGAALLIEIVRVAVREEWAELSEPAFVQRLKFSQVVRPGDALTLTLERRQRGGEARVRFSLERGGVSCSSGELRYPDVGAGRSA